MKRAQPWGTTDFDKLEGRLRHVAREMEIDEEEAAETFQGLVEPGQYLLNEDWTLELVAMWSMRDGLGSQETGMLLSACLQRLHLLQLLGEVAELLRAGEAYPDFPCAVKDLREKIQAVVDE